MRKRYLAAIGTAVLAAALLVSAVPAQASPARSDVVTPEGPSDLRYGDEDVVDFLLFARGPIANDRPELVGQLAMTPVLDAPASVTTRLTSDLRAIDPEFHERVTVKAQTGDPYEAEASLEAFTQDVNALAARFDVTTATLQRAARSASTGSVYAFTNYVVSTQVAIAAAVAVSVLGVVAALVVFAYQRPADSSRLSRQMYASSWATL